MSTYLLRISGFILTVSAVSMVWVGSATAADTTPTSNLQDPPRFPVQLVPQICEAKIGGCDICDVVLVFTNAANIIASALSGMALLMFIVGGFFFIFSSGNEQRIETGRKILTGTVVGVLIVFIAWMGVNYIVRTVYYGAYNAGGVVAGTGAGTGSPKLFSRAWWSPTCSPALTPCATGQNGKGKNVGDQCGTSGDCKSGDSSTSCTCYRDKLKLADKPGEDNPTDLGACGKTGDAAALADVTGDAGKTNADPKTEGGQKCYCSNSCKLLTGEAVKPSALKGYLVECIEKATYESANQNYFKLQYSCENAQQVCVASIEP